MWIKSKILKIRFRLGDLLGTLADTENELKTAKKDYTFYKLTYLKARILKKLKRFDEADQVCHFLLTETQQSYQAFDSGAEESEAPIWWKFGLKAIYMLTSLLAHHCELKYPRTLMTDFALKCLHTLIKSHYPEVSNENPEKVLQDCYYTFQYRRHWAKLRRLGFFLHEAEQIYKSILQDEARYYGLYPEEDISKDVPQILVFDKFTS